MREKMNLNAELWYLFDQIAIRRNLRRGDATKRLVRLQYVFAAIDSDSLLVKRATISRYSNLY